MLSPFVGPAPPPLRRAAGAAFFYFGYSTLRHRLGLSWMSAFWRCAYVPIGCRAAACRSSMTGKGERLGVKRRTQLRAGFFDLDAVHAPLPSRFEASRRQPDRPATAENTCRSNSTEPEMDAALAAASVAVPFAT